MLFNLLTVRPFVQGRELKRSGSSLRHSKSPAISPFAAHPASPEAEDLPEAMTAPSSDMGMATVNAQHAVAQPYSAEDQSPHPLRYIGIPHSNRPHGHWQLTSPVSAAASASGFRPTFNPSNGHSELMQWHISGVQDSSPSSGGRFSPLSPAQSRYSDLSTVTSLRSYTGPMPWLQPEAAEQLDTPDPPTAGPAPAGPSGERLQAPASWEGPAGLPHSTAGPGAPWTHELSVGKWVQAPLIGGDSAGSPIGWGCEPAANGDPAGPAHVQESQTLQEARRLMSGEAQSAPIITNAIHDGDPGPSQRHAVQSPRDHPHTISPGVMSEVLRRQDSAHDLHVQ